MKHGWYRVATVAWIAAVTLDVHAQPEEAQEQPSSLHLPGAADLEKAKQLYRNAEALKSLGDEQAARGEADKARETYGRAVKKYLDGYRLSKLPLFLYNLGSVYRLRGDTRWAVRCYQAFLATGPESRQDVKDTLMFIREIRRELAGGALPDPGDSDPSLDPSGVCVLADQQPTQPDEPRDLERPTPPDEPRDLERPTPPDEPRNLERLDRGDPERPTPPDEPRDLERLDRGDDERPTPPDEPVSSRQGYRAAFWGTTVLTAASVTAATIAGLDVLRLKKQAQEVVDHSGVVDSDGDGIYSCAEASADNHAEMIALCEKSQSRARLTNLFIGAAVLSAAAAGFFFNEGYLGKDTGSRAAPATALHPVLGPTAMGAELTWRF